MRRWLLVTIGLAVVAAACGGDAESVIDPGDGGDYSVDIDRAGFVEGIDNPWLPFATGSHWVYEADEDGAVERIEVVVTGEKRIVMGITATVVRDTVTIDGELIEDTYDWYAQDTDGNVWYLGEDSKEYDGDEMDTAGSWESGVDGALPGIVMRAEPQVGDAYRQEYYEGEAEDMAEVVRVGDSVEVPFGSFGEVLVIREWNPLEPDVIEEKYYAHGVGVILEQKIEGGEGRAELITYEPAG
jgi:hypothetical protein